MPCIVFHQTSLEDQLRIVHGAQACNKLQYHIKAYAITPQTSITSVDDQIFRVLSTLKILQLLSIRFVCIALVKKLQQ